MEDGTLTVTQVTRISDVARWFGERGYAVAFAPHAVVYGKPGEPALIAPVPATLVFENGTISVR